MWRRPLAYGQATATRIFLADRVWLTAVNHRESIFGVPPPRRAEVREESDSGEAGQKAESPQERGAAVHPGAVLRHRDGVPTVRHSRRREDDRQARCGRLDAVTHGGDVTRSAIRRGKHPERGVLGGSRCRSKPRHNGRRARACLASGRRHGWAGPDASRHRPSGRAPPGRARPARERDQLDVRRRRCGYVLDGRDRCRLGRGRRRRRCGGWSRGGLGSRLRCGLRRRDRRRRR